MKFFFVTILLSRENEENCMFLFKKNIKYLEKSNAVVLMGTDPSFFLFFFFFFCMSNIVYVLFLLVSTIFMH